MHRDLLGMLAIWLFALPAAILAGLLTVLKFRSDYQCDAGLLSSCHRGWFTCATIFQDNWSTIAGLPLTVYAAAFYAVLAVLAGLTLWMPRRMASIARTAVLVFAWGGLLVTLALAAYALLALRAMCLYCTYFYGVNVAVFVAARLMHPRGTTDGLRLLVRAPETAAVLAVAVLGLVTGVLVQRASYLRAIAGTDPYALRPCVTRLGGLEPSDIVATSAGEPAFVVKLFVDLDCPYCRDELQMWRELVAASPGGAALELRVYQYPRGVCDMSGQRLDSSPSCNAARALLCLTAGLADAEQAMIRLERMFALQDAPGQHFSHESLARVAREFGHDADPTRPAEADPFFQCMQSVATTATLHRHVRLARDVGELRAAPGALIIPLVDGRPRGEATQVHGRKPRAQIEAWIGRMIGEMERPS